jgi:hypothetical protein
MTVEQIGMATEPLRVEMLYPEALFPAMPQNKLQVGRAPSDRWNVTALRV